MKFFLGVLWDYCALVGVCYAAFNSTGSEYASLFAFLAPLVALPIILEKNKEVLKE